VNFSPVLTTSEDAGPAIPAAAKDSKEDLTSKDVLELLKEMDGLPADM
jgi:hypothetical protein